MTHTRNGTCAQWPQQVAHALDAPNFATGLPQSALTLIELADDDCRQRHPWLTAVVPAVADLIINGRPVLYVESGGPQPGGPAADYLTNFCDDALLVTHLDEDPRMSEYSVIAIGPCGRDGCPDQFGAMCERCCVPTLGNVRRQLDTHDAAHGQGIVFLDQVESMRPYLEMTQSGASPSSTEAALACGLRAVDLLTFAQSRSTATIAVSGRQGPGGAPESLRAVSLMHITVWTPDAHDRGYVVVAHRSHLCEEWRTVEVDTDVHVLAWRSPKWRGGY